MHFISYCCFTIVVSPLLDFECLKAGTMSYFIVYFQILHSAMHRAVKHPINAVE